MGRFTTQYDSGWNITISRDQARTDPDRIACLTAALQKIGMVRIEAQYSGGNDEGGVDSIQAYSQKFLDESKAVEKEEKWRDWGDKLKELKASGDVVDIQETKYGSASAVEGLSAEEVGDVVDIIEAPVQIEWGSFAGDFYVSGSVVFEIGWSEISFDGSYSDGEFAFDLSGQPEDGSLIVPKIYLESLSQAIFWGKEAAPTSTHVPNWDALQVMVNDRIGANK